MMQAALEAGVKVYMRHLLVYGGSRSYQSRGQGRRFTMR